FEHFSIRGCQKNQTVVQRRTWPSDGTKDGLFYSKEIVIHRNHCSSAETANPKQRLMPRSQLSHSASETTPACCFSGFLVFCKKLFPSQPFRYVE
ncbi:unnamed protein product, partial [Musa textilis]